MCCINFQKLGIPRSTIEKLIDEWILNERDRQLMKRRHIDGIPFEKLAEEFNLSTRQTQKIVYRHDLVLKKHI